MAPEISPALVPWPPTGDASRFLSRRFADRQRDLDVDFDRPRTDVVTDLIAGCLRVAGGETVTAESAWQWTVSDRLQALLAIAYAATGPATTAVATCGHEECLGQVELELELAGFAAASPERITWQSPDGRLLGCRVPTGADQRAWQQHAAESGQADPAWLAARLLDDEEIATVSTDEWLEPLAAALDSVDPLTSLTLDVACPYCGYLLAVDVDIEGLLVEGLRRRQRQLLEQVHRLASRYHWSEPDIVALPEWRRERYLARIAMETA